MRILIVTPTLPSARTGNGVTAARWAGLLRQLGHRVGIARDYRGQACDVLVALHARKGAPSVERFRRRRGGAPLVLALTGTDVYGELARSARARRAVALASRLVVLQPLALDALDPAARRKAHVVLQSAVCPPARPRRRAGAFDVCVLAHLRPVKDPLLAARAARLLPAGSRIQVEHAGAALSPRMRRVAESEMRRNARYTWRGSLPRARAVQLLARSRLLVVSSRLEGGANVVSEALACGVPVLSTRIPGSVGILGRDFPGYFPAGDARALARLLWRAETDRRFYDRLEKCCRRLRPLVAPARERATWRRLLAALRP